MINKRNILDNSLVSFKGALITQGKPVEATVSDAELHSLGLSLGHLRLKNEAIAHKS